MKYTNWICTFFLAISSLAFSDNPELLKKKDINKIMEQILTAHLGGEQISAKVIKNALKVYIEQFDPNYTYLLESEVDPYLKISDAETTNLIYQYKQSDYSVFERLNTVIQKSIIRSREIRKELESANAQLFQTALQGVQKHPGGESKKTYAKTPEELKERIRKQFTAFIHAEKKRFGDDYVYRNEKPLISLYEKYLQAFEDQYLYTDENNKVLPDDEKENLFTLHVLKSLASSLDAHTEFFSPAEAYDMRMHLEKGFQGIGVTLKQTPTGLEITNLSKDGPAEKSGQVLVHDKLIEINGASIANEDLATIMQKLQGKIGSEVKLGLQRNENGIDRLINVSLKREEITIDEDRVEASYETFGSGIIGKITLDSFYQNSNGVTSEHDVQNAIEKLEKIGNVRGIILDLRENTGGFLSQAVKVVGLFITNGVVVISKYNNGEEHFFRDMDVKIAYHGPLVVLTSRMTASAAEIVAQALQDYGVAVVVGDEQTYGKGTIQTQTVTQNKASSFFKVTVGEYYTVSGKTPQIQGVKADVVVPGKYSNSKIGEKYKESVVTKSDSIPAAYQDDFQDVEPAMKSWYLRYYAPTIQQKIDFWKNQMPILRKNSSYRIANNKSYQRFIEKLRKTDDESENSEWGDTDEDEAKNPGRDLQMTEAVNVLKDMIYLLSNTSRSDETATFEEKATK